MTDVRDEVRKVDLTRVRPYGDILDDGAVQLSFTLPVPAGPEAQEAAKQLARKMGLDDPGVSYMHDLGVGYTYFVVFGKCTHSVDYTATEVPRADVSVMSFEEVNRSIREKLERKVTVVGAATGTDAHTVGLDAIMNMKGYNGAYGLERYPEFIAINMGSQVPNERLLARAIETNADVILVSQVVTQRNVHIPNLTQLVELVEAEGLRDKVLLICGGPRITHELAVELGYDAGFGSGTLPSEVASFIVQEMVRRDMK